MTSHLLRYRDGATPIDAWLLRLLRVLGLVVLTLALVACSTLQREPFTAAEDAVSSVPGIPDARYWADSTESARAAVQLARQSNEPFNYLALSGGGGDGAFGAGFLEGWTKRDNRPEFTVVSGVSTGALIAPFAFLGSAYDPVLRQMYTGGYGITLVDTPDPLSALFGAGLFDGRRLNNLVRQFVTADVIRRIGEEHGKGRRLLVVTTNLDAQRAVVWDMGAIAASNVPGAAELFRAVLTASASIPGVFTPTYLPAQAGDHRFAEMHVDGGVVSNVFTLPDDILRNHRKLSPSGSANVYVILNGKLDPSFEMVQSSTVGIVGRAVGTMTQVQSRDTIQATYDFARRNGIGFRLASVPTDNADAGTMSFDTDVMRRLFAIGYNQAVSGRPWETSPVAPAPQD